MLVSYGDDEMEDDDSTDERRHSSDEDVVPTGFISYMKSVNLVALIVNGWLITEYCQMG